MCITIPIKQEHTRGTQEGIPHNKRNVRFGQDEPHVLPRQAGYNGQQNHLRQ